MLQERLSRLQGELQNLGLDCLTLIAGTNLKYMTGLSFHLMDARCWACSLPGAHRSWCCPRWRSPNLKRHNRMRSSPSPIQMSRDRRRQSDKL